MPTTGKAPTAATSRKATALTGHLSRGPAVELGAAPEKCPELDGRGGVGFGGGGVEVPAVDRRRGDLNISASQTYALVRSRDLRGIQVGGRNQWRVERVMLEEY